MQSYLEETTLKVTKQCKNGQHTPWTITNRFIIKYIIMRVNKQPWHSDRLAAKTFPVLYVTFKPPSLNNGM